MIETRKLSIGYGKKVLARDISFFLRNGECALLCGANGSGKSTLLKTIAGRAKALSGEILTDSTVAMVPTKIPKIKGFTLEEFILTGCYRETDWWGRGGKTVKKAIAEAEDILGLENLVSCDISEISDGEFQKACIASALSLNAGVLLLDEPTAFLDVDSRSSVLASLKNVAQQKNICILFSSHDIHESSLVCDRILGLGHDSSFLDSANSSKEQVLAKCFRQFSPDRQLLSL